jgi:MOB kinase activator 1
MGENGGNINLLLQQRNLQTTLPIKEQGFTLQQGKQWNNTKTIGVYNVMDVVARPEGIPQDEWMATCAVQFMNDLNLVVALAKDSVVAKGGGLTVGKHEYAWQDEKNPKYKEPTKVTAIVYMEECLYWANSLLNDEVFCPTTPEAAFPADFNAGIEKIFRRFFRVYAHIYHQHYKKIEEMEAVEHLNHVFKKFAIFCKMNKILPENELEPLKDLVNMMWSEHIVAHPEDADIMR